MSSNFPNRATFHFWMNMDKNIHSDIQELITAGNSNQVIEDRIKLNVDKYIEMVSDKVIGALSGIERKSMRLIEMLCYSVLTDLTFDGAIDYEYIVERIRREMDSESGSSQD